MYSFGVSILFDYWIRHTYIDDSVRTRHERARFVVVARIEKERERERFYLRDEKDAPPWCGLSKNNNNKRNVFPPKNEYRVALLIEE